MVTFGLKDVWDGLINKSIVPQILLSHTQVTLLMLIFSLSISLISSGSNCGLFLCTLRLRLDILIYNFFLILEFLS